MYVKEILIRALEAVEEAKIPNELKPVAFSKAVDLFTNQVGTKKIQETQKLSGQTSTSIGASSGTEGIAAKLKLPMETIASIYDFDDSKLNIHIVSSNLESSKKGGTQQLALLAVAARQASGLDEKYTDMNEIRQYCEDYKKYDSPNFAKTIKGMEHEFNLSVKGNKRLIKMSQQGWEKASELVQSLATNSAKK